MSKKQTIDNFVLTIPDMPEVTSIEKRSFVPRYRASEPNKFNIEIFEKDGVLYVREESRLGVKEVAFDEYEGRVVNNNYSQNDPRVIFPAFSVRAGYMVKDLEGLCVDFGCNNGHFLKKVVPKFVNGNLRYLGLDLNEEALEEARKGASEQHTFIKGDICNTGLQGGCASLVTANSALSYPKWPKLAIKEMGRILRPDGVAFITDTFYNVEDYKRWMQEEGFKDIKDCSCITRAGEGYFVITARKK
jgi:SAM-dependent methyltransferase